MKKIIIALVVVIFGGLFALNYHVQTGFDWEADQKVTDYIDSMSYVDDVEELMGDDFHGFVYFGKSSSQECEDIEFVLMRIVRREKDLRVYNFDTDVWNDKEHFSEFLEKYQIESAPTLIKVEEDGTYSAFDGFDGTTKTEEELEKDLREFLLG